MNKIFETKHYGASFKDVDTAKRIVTGYLASFNTLDSDGDIIQPGAFKKTVQESGPDSARPRIKWLMNHRPDQPLGKFLILKETDLGLYYEGQVGKHALGIDFLAQVDAGIITEHSIGFKTIKENKSKNARYLQELKLYEGSSLTHWGANENTPLTGTKGLLDGAAQQIDSLRRSLKENQDADEALDLVDIQLKQLNQYFIDNNLAAKAPDPKIDEAVLREINSINSFLKSKISDRRN